MSDSEVKAQAQERFGKFAQGYVESKGHASGDDLDRLIELVQPQPDWLMLDVATGGGHTALKFAPLVKKVVAWIISKKCSNRTEVLTQICQMVWA